MSKTERAKGTVQPGGDLDAPLEAAFAALEERFEKLVARFLELTEENRRLRGGLEETEAARDRLKVALEEAREQLGAGADVNEKVLRFEEEREAIRGRIERLIKSLEDVAPPSV